MEKSPKRKINGPSFLKDSETFADSPLLQKFSEKYVIDFDDEKEVLEKLAKIPQYNITVGLHNLLTGNISLVEALKKIKSEIEFSERNGQEEMKEMFQLMFQFTEKYGVPEAIVLIRLLEGEVEHL